MATHNTLPPKFIDMLMGPESAFGGFVNSFARANYSGKPGNNITDINWDQPAPAAAAAAHSNDTKTMKLLTYQDDDKFYVTRRIFPAGTVVFRGMADPTGNAKNGKSWDVGSADTAQEAIKRLTRKCVQYTSAPRYYGALGVAAMYLERGGAENELTVQVLNKLYMVDIRTYSMLIYKVATLFITRKINSLYNNSNKINDFCASKILESNPPHRPINPLWFLRTKPNHKIRSNPTSFRDSYYHGAVDQNCRDAGQDTPQECKNPECTNDVSDTYIDSEFLIGYMAFILAYSQVLPVKDIQEYIEYYNSLVKEKITSDERQGGGPSPYRNKLFRQTGSTDADPAQNLMADVFRSPWNGFTEMGSCPPKFVNTFGFGLSVNELDDVANAWLQPILEELGVDGVYSPELFTPWRAGQGCGTGEYKGSGRFNAEILVFNPQGCGSYHMRGAPNAAGDVQLQPGRYTIDLTKANVPGEFYVFNTSNANGGRIGEYLQINSNNNIDATSGKVSTNILCAYPLGKGLTFDIQGRLRWIGLQPGCPSHGPPENAPVNLTKLTIPPCGPINIVFQNPNVTTWIDLPVMKKFLYSQSDIVILINEQPNRAHPTASI